MRIENEKVFADFRAYKNAHMAGYGPGSPVVLFTEKEIEVVKANLRIDVLCGTQSSIKDHPYFLVDMEGKIEEIAKQAGLTKEPDANIPIF